MSLNAHKAMRKKNIKKSKHENDEYSILKETNCEHTGVTWNTFNKNEGSETHTYDLNGIFNKESTLHNEQSKNIIKIDNQKPEPQLKDVNTHDNKESLVRLGVLENNISVKRYFDHMNKNEENPSTNCIEQSNSLENTISTKPAAFEDNNVLPTRDRHKIFGSLVNNKAQLDIEKCKTLLKKREEQAMANEKRNVLLFSNVYEPLEPTIKDANNISRSKTLSTITEINDSSIHVGKRKTTNQKSPKRLKDKLIIADENYQSTIIETKKRLDEAIEQVKTEQTIQEKPHATIKDDKENKTPTNIIYTQTELNTKRKVNLLEKENRLLRLENSALMAKIDYLVPKDTIENEDGCLCDGDVIFNSLREQIHSVEQEYKISFEKINQDKKNLEIEIVGLKKIINKLVDKLKSLKSKMNSSESL